MPRRRTDSDDDQCYQPIGRCCARHADWATLAQHVVERFPHLPLSDIAREMRIAKAAIETVDVGDDALEVAELIARHRLMIAAGDADDVAKLDPQKHDRQLRSAV